MGALVQTLPHHHRLRPAKEGSAPSSPVPGFLDRPVFRRIIQPSLTLRPAELLASRPGPPPSGQQRLLHPSFPHRRSPHGEVGYHYAAVWTLAATELASAGKVLLWAATLLIPVNESVVDVDVEGSVVVQEHGERWIEEL